MNRLFHNSFNSSVKYNKSIVNVSATGYRLRQYSGDGSAATATTAGVYQPKEVAVDSYSAVYFTDSTKNRVRMVVNSRIYTIAGDGNSGTVL